MTDLLTRLRLAENIIIRVDGDRDHMNKSEMTCEQTSAIAGVLREAIEFLATPREVLTELPNVTMAEGMKMRSGRPTPNDEPTHTPGVENA